MNDLAAEPYELPAPRPRAEDGAVTTIDARIAAFGELASRAGLDRLVLAGPLTLSWLLGVRNNVRLGGDQPYFAVELDWRSGGGVITYIAPRHEVDRLTDVQLARVNYSGTSRVLTHEWSQTLWDVVDLTGAVGSDVRRHGIRYIGSEVDHLRRVLDPAHEQDLRELTTAVITVVEGVVRDLEPGTSERDVAASVAAGLVRVDVEPLVVLVGSGTDLERYKHPVPRAVPIEGRVMVSVGARRYGLVTSVTRYRSFSPLTDDEAEQYRQLLEVDAAMLAASAPGARLSEVLEAGIEAYRREGFAEGAWLQHHQGGLAGLAPREMLAGSANDLTLAANMVVAWNPSAHGWKVEDVALVGDSGAQPVGGPGETWPAIEVAGRQRPAVLQPSAQNI